MQCGSAAVKLFNGNTAKPQHSSTFKLDKLKQLNELNEPNEPNKLNKPNEPNKPK